MPKRLLQAALLALGLLAHAGSHGASPLVVVVNRGNPLSSLSIEQLRKLLLGEVREWPNRLPVIVVEREEDSPVFWRMLQLALRMTGADYRRWQLHTQFRGELLPRLKTLRSDDGALRYVFNVPGAIAVVGAGIPESSSSQVKILKIDGKLPGQAGYALE